MTLLNREQWTVWVDSDEPPTYAGHKAIDGNPASFWHTKYTGGSPGYPHSLMVDLGALANLGGMRVLPRQDASVNGQIGAYEVYVKTDSAKPPILPPIEKEWTRVAFGEFPHAKSEQEINFAPVSSRYVWLKALNEVQGKDHPWASLAELHVLATTATAERPSLPLWKVIENVPGLLTLEYPHPHDPNQSFRTTFDMRPRNAKGELI